MSFPFGGHPTFGQYLIFARDEHGFTVLSGYSTDSRGRSHQLTRIFKEGGPSLIVVGTDQKEHLTPSAVGNYDRRLGIKSPWFSVDISDMPEF